MIRDRGAATSSIVQRHHIALHLAHRWFAFLEAPGGNLHAHLKIFHPQVRLSGHRGTRLFAHDHQSLVTWFAAIPDAISSHHIIHSTYATVGEAGVMNMVVAYQSPGETGMHGSIISYETLVEFTPEGARFVALDKTPILGNTKVAYETSWSTNRVLARVHAELGGIGAADGLLRAALGNDVQRVTVQASAPEGSSAYGALLTSSGGDPVAIRAVRLIVTDDVAQTMPIISRMTPLAAGLAG